MEKHIMKELADIASEMRLAGAAMTDLMDAALSLASLVRIYSR